MSVEPAGSTESWTVGRLLNWTAEYLARNGVDEAKLCAEVLLAHSAQCRRIDLYARFKDEPAPEVVDRFRDLVRRAVKHEPPAYLTGEKEFFSLAFEVGPGVLIPRPETETLVEAAIDRCRSRDLSAVSFLDVGTGSGCISVALLTQLPQARGWATDRSEAALEYAARNAEKHGVADRLVLSLSDRLAISEDARPEDGLFDLIVCNPPYISKEDVAGLEATVREYEPVDALTDGGDGLSFYRSLAADGPGLVREGGAIVVEVAAGQAEAVARELVGPGLEHERTVKDRVCGHKRVVVVSRVS